jgi:hypothetical protein
MNLLTHLGHRCSGETHCVKDGEFASAIARGALMSAPHHEHSTRRAVLSLSLPFVLAFGPVLVGGCEAPDNAPPPLQVLGTGAFVGEVYVGGERLVEGGVHRGYDAARVAYERAIQRLAV